MNIKLTTVLSPLIALRALHRTSLFSHLLLSPLSVVLSSALRLLTVGSEKFTPLEDMPISEPFPQVLFWQPLARESGIRTLTKHLSNESFHPEIQDHGKLSDEAEAVAWAIELEAFMVTDIAAFSPTLIPI